MPSGQLHELGNIGLSLRARFKPPEHIYCNTCNIYTEYLEMVMDWSSIVTARCVKNIVGDDKHEAPTPGDSVWLPSTRFLLTPGKLLFVEYNDWKILYRVDVNLCS